MKKMKILHLEDSPDDAILINKELKKAGLYFELQWVEDKAEFEKALYAFNPDVVLSDHSLINFNSTEALEMVKATGSIIPFILVTATVTEWFAVSVLKNGAEDYILKDRIQRLPNAITRALQKRDAEREIQRRHEELSRNEQKFRALIENTNDLISLFNDQLRMTYLSPNFHRITGWASEELKLVGGLSLVHPEDLPLCQSVMEESLANPRQSFHVTYRLKHHQGHYIWLEGIVTNWLHDASIAGIVSNMRDVTKERKMQLANREVQERLLFHVENSPLGFIEWSTDFKIKSCSRRAEEIFGWLDHEYAAHDMNGFSYVYQEDMEIATRIANELSSGTEVRNHTQHRNVKKDGSVIWCEWFNSVLKNDCGEVETIMSLVKDITERKTAEELTRKSQANLAAIIENTDAFIFSLDKELRYITFNPALKDNIRAVYQVDLQPGMKVLSVMRIEDETEASEWEKIYRKVLAGSAHQLVRNYSTEWTKSYFNFSLNPIVENDSVIGISCFCSNITEQHLAKEKIIQSELRFRALIDNSYDAIVLRDEQFHVLYSSPSAHRILGLSPDEEMERDFADRIHPHDLPLVANIKNEIMKNAGKPYFMTFRKRHEHGHYVWVEGVMTNLLHQRGIEGIVSNFRDITERHQSEEERTHLVAQLIEQNNDLMQFSFIASHNLRGPVASMLGLVNLLDSYENKEEAVIVAHHMKASAQKLDSIIGDLSDIVNVRTSAEHQKESVNIHSIISEIQVIFQLEIRQFPVEFDLYDMKLKEMHTIRAYLYSILFHLISNSIKFRSSHRALKIKISTVGDGKSVTLMIEDNGMGIDLDQFGQKLFGLYQRFHLHVEGKGLGLYMVRTQVQALNGNIDLVSKPGEGTTIRIKFRV